MTLILKLDLDMVKVSLHTKNEVSMLRYSKVIARTDRQTDTHTHTYTHTDTLTETQTHRRYGNITFPGGNNSEHKVLVTTMIK